MALTPGDLQMRFSRADEETEPGGASRPDSDGKGAIEAAGWCAHVGRPA